MAVPQKKDKTTAALLAWFLGPFGVHRFYLGQNSMGVGYILGTITIIGAIVTGIVSFVDFIGFLIMSQDDFDRRYNPHLIAGNAYETVGAPHSGPSNVADEIRKLDTLFQDGVITFEEFEKRKARLLNH